VLNHVIRFILIPFLIIAGAGHVNAYSGNTGGLSPRLSYLLRRVEAHFHRPLQVISGCRSHAHNRRIGGARESWHLRCMAADIKLVGVNKGAVARYAAGLPGRGGIGTYCHDSNVHIDLGPRREWYWGCGGQRAFHQGSLHRMTYRKHRNLKHHRRRRHA
jgi:Peptidase M15